MTHFRILADQSLPLIDQAFPKPFEITYYTPDSNLSQLLQAHDILIARSTLKLNAENLEHSRIRIILTASSGTDHIDESYLNKHHIQLFDAKGCNAHAVSDYVMCTIAHLMQRRALVPRSIGIIGFGAVGQCLFQHLSLLPCPVRIFDPYCHPPQACAWQEVLQSDILCVHANLHHQPPYPSFHLLNREALKMRQPHQIIINAARGGIVDEQALLEVHQGIYCTDVYQHEPNIAPAVVQHAYQCTPHIAGHTQEAKQRAIHILSQKLHHYLKRPAPKLPSIQSPHRALEWPDTYLHHYDPQIETQALKSAIQLAPTFIKLRSQHQRWEIHAEP
jgi:erythronate-4-phosphate dehydrogenase